MTNAVGGTGGARPGDDARAANGPSGPRLRTTGAPDTSSADFDADGLSDGQDSCPDVPRGTDANADGCPDRTRLADADGDEIPDGSDACPSAARGANDANEDGCPDGGTGGGTTPPPPTTTPSTPDPGTSTGDGSAAAGGGSGPATIRIVNPRFVWDGRWNRLNTRFIAFVVSDVAAGTTVRLTCRGRGCPRKAFRKTFARATRRVDLSPHLRRRKLAVGAVLELRSTAPGARGTVQRFVIRKNKRPLVTQLCVAVGATKAARC